MANVPGSSSQPLSQRLLGWGLLSLLIGPWIAGCLANDESGTFTPVTDGVTDATEPRTQATITSNGNNTFILTVTNVLKAQGQHVMLDADDSSGWTLSTASPPHSLDGGKTATFDVQIHAAGEPGATLPPYEFNIITDIGGLRSLYASMTPGGVELVQDPTLATAASIDTPPRDTPLPLWAPIVAAGVAAALLAGRRG